MKYQKKYTEHRHTYVTTYHGVYTDFVSDIHFIGPGMNRIHKIGIELHPSILQQEKVLYCSLDKSYHMAAVPMDKYIKKIIEEELPKEKRRVKIENLKQKIRDSKKPTNLLDNLKLFYNQWILR